MCLCPAWEGARDDGKEPGIKHPQGRASSGQAAPRPGPGGRGRSSAPPPGLPPAQAPRHIALRAPGLPRLPPPTGGPGPVPGGQPPAAPSPDGPTSPRFGCCPDHGCRAPVTQHWGGTLILRVTWRRGCGQGPPPPSLQPGRLGLCGLQRARRGHRRRPPEGASRPRALGPPHPPAPPRATPAPGSEGQTDPEVLAHPGWKGWGGLGTARTATQWQPWAGAPSFASEQWAAACPPSLPGEPLHIPQGPGQRRSAQRPALPLRLVCGRRWAPPGTPSGCGYRRQPGSRPARAAPPPALGRALALSPPGPAPPGKSPPPVDVTHLPGGTAHAHEPGTFCGARRCVGTAVRRVAERAPRPLGTADTAAEAPGLSPGAPWGHQSALLLHKRGN